MATEVIISSIKQLEYLYSINHGRVDGWSWGDCLLKLQSFSEEPQIEVSAL